MTKKDFIALYGKSVYTVRIDIANALFVNGCDIKTALLQATDVVETLLGEEKPE